MRNKKNHVEWHWSPPGLWPLINLSLELFPMVSYRLYFRKSLIILWVMLITSQTSDLTKMVCSLQGINLTVHTWQFCTLANCSWDKNCTLRNCSCCISIVKIRTAPQPLILAHLNALGLGFPRTSCFAKIETLLSYLNRVMRVFFRLKSKSWAERF